MAKLERRLFCGFYAALGAIDNGILKGSVSACLEDSSDFAVDNVRCAVRVYERYSWFGSNRVSLSVTLVGRDGDLLLSASTSGGSQAVFFKINTVGERAFLEKLRAIVDDLC